MVRTTIYDLEFGAKIWQKSHEGKAIPDTWNTKIHCKKIGKPEDIVNPEEHETYRSGVGTLLYLTKHGRPDICNPVRELSKTLDAPAPVLLKEMHKLIRFVLSTKDFGFKFKLMKNIKKEALKALSDSDFASDKETRISILGYIICFHGIPIAWRSKGMKSVVLSTTEAEYMA